MYEQNPMVGPGNAGLWNHTLEILLLLLGAFILGYLLRYAISRMQIETQNRELEVERRHRRTLEADFDRVRAEHTAMGSRISTLEGDVNRGRTELAESHQKIEFSAGELSALKTEAAAFPTQLERLRAELAAANANVGKVAELNAQILELTSQLEACAAKTRALEASAGKIGSDAELSTLRAQASRFDDLSGDLIGARTELSAALASKDAMQAELDRLRSEMDSQRQQAKPKAAGKPDDLKVVEGIGPKINELLLAGGIRTFIELADAPINRLKQILHDAGERYRIHDPSSWPQQARLCAEGQWDALRDLQDKLVAGRNG